jgi:hypothetical protein
MGVDGSSDGVGAEPLSESCAELQQGGFDVALREGRRGAEPGFEEDAGAGNGLLDGLAGHRSIEADHG